MNKQHWMELREEAPCAVGACLLYFQDRYLGQWALKMTNPKAVIAYLKTQAYEVRITQFGLPNRKDWYYEITHAGDLLQHARGFPTYQAAATEAIRFVFIELEQ